MALTKPFAEQGEKKAISLTPDAEGTMNYQDGFGQRYSLPVKSTISEDGTITTTGGLWIQREQFNQLMFDTTSAIIENQDNITQLNQDLGNKDDLTTTNKDNIVSAINELDSNIGDLQDLTTTEKSNVVSAINEIDSNYVRLDTEQTIPSVKTFSNVVNFGSIVNVNGEANFNGNVEMVNTPTITSPKTFQDLIDNELITKAQSVSKFVDFDTNQSVSGLKTFTALPQSEATPTDDKDLTTKLYVDTTLSDKIAGIGKAMGFKGIVENATDLPTDTATDGDMYYNKASSGETEDNKKGFYVFNGTAFDFIGATISMDFDKIFEIEEKQGDLTQLKTTAKDSLVNAINENYDNIATNSNNIGTLGNLTTTAKDNLVNAINENKASIDTNKSQVDSSLGDLTQLKTTAKDSLVNAINENYDSIETNSQHIADNEGAISTINNNIGDLQDLTTTAKDNLVNAINEIKKAGAGGDTTNMDLKGTKATYQEIEDLADMVMGDVWECTEVGKEGFYIYDGAAWKLLGSGGGGTPTPPPEITLNPNPVITFTVAPTEWTDVTDDADKKLRGNYKVTKNIDKKGVTNAIFISATSTVTNINYSSILGISIKLVITADAVTQVEIYSYSKPEADVTLLVDLLLVIQETAYGVGIFNIKQDGSFIYTQAEYDSLELGAKTNGLIYVVQG